MAVARVWPADPNWSSSYSITYSFKTQILTSRSGREQRSALRRTPRKTLEYKATLRLEALQDLKRLAWSHQHLSFVAAEEPRYTALTADVAAGALVFHVAETPDWLVADGMIVLVNDGQREMLTIDSVDTSAKTVTTTSFTEFSWPKGARLHYGLSGFVASSLQSTRPTSMAGQMSVVFEGAPSSEAFEAQPDAAFTLFGGVPVFLKKPNWSQAPAITSLHDVVAVDFGRGAVSRFTPVPFGQESRQAVYVGRNFAEAEAIRKLFFRCMGRLKPFWAPTWEYDIPLLAPVPSGNASMSVAGWDFFDAFGGSTVHKALFVKWADGTVGYRRIAAMAATTSSGGARVTTITLVSAFSKAVNPATDMVGWLYLNRFSSDDLTIEWITRTVAQAQIQYTSVEVEPNLADLL